MADLRKSLSERQAAALTQGQAIHGLGGVGKTQLAIEYAYRYSGDYEIVWWLRSEEPTTLAGDYAGLAIKLGLPEKEAQEQSIIVAAVKEWLRLHSGWLLIFDNATDSHSVRDYIPQNSTGHTLVTSRNANWRGLMTPFAVRKMDARDAIAFLLKRTGQTDETSAKEIVKELDYLPLALEQAGAYIDATGSSLLRYLELFRTRQQEMLKRGKPSTDYPATVATTWEMAFQEVEHKSQAAADLMKLSAFFAPDDISLQMISKGAEHLPEPLKTAVADTLVLDEAVEDLRAYSLVERKDESLSIHRLVQAVTRHRLSEEEFKNWVEIAISVVNEAFPENSGDVRTWSIIVPLLPHSTLVVEFSESIRSVTTHTSRLLNQMGVYFNYRADYAQAKSLHQRALAISKEALGENHPDVAICLSNLGSVLQDLGDLAGAKAHYERALAMDEKALGENHPTVGIDINNLGLVLQDLGDLAGAKAHFERALAISEEALGENHPTVAIRLSNLGLVLQDLGDLAGAKAHYERALAMDEKAFGENHPDVAIDINNLGLVLKNLGDLAGAKAHFERALAISEEAFGKYHPQVAIYANNLGGALKALGDLAGAKAHFERALAISEEALGENHPTVAIRLSNLGLVLQDLGDLAGAKAHYERALAIFREFLGDEHASTKIVRGHLESLDE